MGNQQGSVFANDESLESLGSRLSTMNDEHELGFGFLDGLVKQPLVKVDPRGFQSHIAVNVSIERVENTATTEGAIACRQLLMANQWLGNSASTTNAEEGQTQQTQAKTMLVVSFKRAIAKRKIPTPELKDLGPVKTNQVASDGRWPIGLYGNCVCIEEYYGGQISIALERNHDSKMPASKMEVDLNAVMADGKVKSSFVKACVMKLIRLLKTLPIKRAVQVGCKTVDIETVAMFPRGLTVGATLEDAATREKLREVLQTFQDTGHKDTDTCLLVSNVNDAVEHAWIKDRLLLSALSSLVNSILETVRLHGKRVELHERFGERRLRF